MKQEAVLKDVAEQIAAGQKALSGVMLESYLKTGKQSVEERTPGTTGLSVTDGCLGWEETSAVILDAFKRLP